ncbi:hypothetical protein RhiirC2_782199 [Rhizophagus irregularis]|uniref:Helitron helicase-like domain-containing protein n=1 Tax=Rhizophagus irregularis TaxID=588596 RepID=A0A2N1N3Q9_9GLOM|nr:hypothetical protein RhiirC2_782199 [Rhizophagus irregularis]
MISNGNKQLADRVMRCGEGLRGSIQFWMARRRELFDMIKQIGHRGLLFFTFSAADFHWPELHKLMPEDGYSASGRFENFFNDVLKPRWDLEDWWYRFEWKCTSARHRKLPQLINAPIPRQHPCQKASDEITDDTQDYIASYNDIRFLLPSDQKKTCRFGYPIGRNDHTFIRDDKNGQPELVTARNDPYINPHNRLQLQGWRANVDLKPVLSIHAALQYISKYASKAEPRSLSFSEIFDQILRNKLLFNSVSERDITAQETCHLLLGIPLYYSSRPFVSLNLNEIGPRWIHGTGSGPNGEEFTTIDDVGRTNQSPLRKYWNRPDELENFTLFKLYLIEKDVLLHVSHRIIAQLNENKLPWSTLYHQHIDTINKDSRDLLGEPVDNEEQLSDNESEYEPPEDEEEEEFRIYLAEMGPNSKSAPCPN